MLLTSLRPRAKLSKDFNIAVGAVLAVKRRKGVVVFDGNLRACIRVMVLKTRMSGETKMKYKPRET